MSTTESIASSQTSLSSWRKSDTTWTLGLFGTAIGAGVLFFPIRAGFGGLIPILVMLVLLVKHRLTRMPIGRAWEALREDEIACRAMGLNHVLVKLSAFMLGASTAGIAGVFFASYQGFVNPTSFTFFESALILAIVVLGGMGSTLGVVLAAFVLTVTPELLRGFDEYRVLLFGVLMVMMMIWRPRGLVRTSRSGVALRKGVAP
ncbi:TPA: hypothetical protein ACPUO5_000779 [Klebsiella pneumoniae]